MNIAGYDIEDSGLTRDRLLAITQAIAGVGSITQRSALLQHFSPAVARDLARGLCVAPALRAVLETAALLGLRPAIDDDVATILCARDSGVVPDQFATDHFHITFHTSGRCMVPELDAREPIYAPGDAESPIAWIEPGAAPNYVKRLAFWLETARAIYLTAFKLADPSPKGPVHVCVTSGHWGGASPGLLTVACNLDHDILCCAAVHELFHVFQYPYRAAGPWSLALFEGGAVFAEDTIADRTNRYLYLASQGEGVLARPEQSLERASYDAAILWHYLAEQWRPDAPSSDTALAFSTLYQDAAAQSCSTPVIDRAVRRLFSGRGFVTIADTERGDTPGPLTRETLLGNYALACYLKDVPTVVDRRFQIRDNSAQIYFALLMGESATPPRPVAVTDSRIVSVTSGVALFTASIEEFGHRYYELHIDPGLSAVDITFCAGVELGAALFQIACLDATGQLVDVYRAAGPTYRKRVHSTPSRRIGRLVLVVSSSGSPGDFQISSQAAPPSPDAKITRRYCPSGREYEMDPQLHPWTDISPDLWVENKNGEWRDSVILDEDNPLMVRVHNLGMAQAAGLRVDFEVWTRAGWAPVRDSLGRTQAVREADLAPQTVGVWNVPMCPKASDVERLAIRATVFVPADPNADNKVAISEFRCETKDKT